MPQAQDQLKEDEEEDGRRLGNDGLTCGQFIELCYRLKQEGSVCVLEALRESRKAGSSPGAIRNSSPAPARALGAIRK